ncbi:MAG: type II toxin-antitoxin system VapB family antitoxin [Methylacidiphilales bacterium]|jgi:Arc/MetJ family transcription regulator|nr:type II toxin-antitoxin system VapB family antitoxin [Candidatus Methylacidiphilales bacterium]
MKTTVDIPDKELRDVIKNTRAKTKREAVVAAVSEYNRRCRVEKILGFLGKMDGIMTQAELRRMREDR